VVANRLFKAEMNSSANFLHGLWAIRHAVEV